MKQITYVGIMSLAKIQGILMGVMGLLLTLLYVGIGLVNIVMGNNEVGTVLIILAVVAPILYALLGFVSGALLAYVYNIVAKKYGGIVIDLK